MKKYGYALPLLASLVILLLVGCGKGSGYGGSNGGYGGGGGGTSSGNSVSISGSGFSSLVLDVAAGTKVTWTNNDNTTHTVTSDNGLFDSGDIPYGGKFSYTFTTNGTYPYHCTYHANMKASVKVN